MRKLRQTIFIFGLVLLLLVGTPFSAMAGEKPSGKPFKALWEEIDKLQLQLDDLQAQIDDMQAQINDLQAQIDGLQAQLDDLLAMINALQAQLDAEIAARIAADSDLQNQIDDLQDQLDSEIAARIAADSDLQNQIDDLQDQLDAEIAARIAADSNLQGQIDNLQDQLDAEIAARIAADLALQAAIDLEKTERIAADSGLQFQIDNHEHVGEDITSGKIANARLNMGHNMGLDADTLDGLHASDLTCKWSESDSDIHYMNGNVGIDVMDPTQRLHVEGNVRISGAIYDSSNNPGTAGQMLQSTGSGIDWVDVSILSDGDWTVSGNDIYSAVSGNVGIGTINPATNLHIEDSSTLSNDLLTLYSNVNPGNEFGIVFGIGDAGRIEGGAIRLRRMEAPGGGSLSFSTSPASGMDATEKMVIAGNGYVGIGTEEPLGMLHVVGSGGGFIFWNYEGIDDNPITIIQDGPGDIETYCQYNIIVTENLGLTLRSIRGGTTPGNMYTLYNDGTNILILVFGTDGSVTIVRESGTMTFDVAIQLMWL